MQLKLLLTVFIVGFLLVIHNLSAQTISSTDISKIKISQLSDQQIMEFSRRIQSSGLSEDEAIKQLEQRGFDPIESAVLRERLAKLQSGSKMNTAKSPSAVKKPPINQSRDTTTIPNILPAKRKSLIYGYDFFNNPNLKFEPNIRLATPQNYVLGSDDEVIIMLTGLNETSITGKISPDGKIQIPYVGLVHLNGLTIEEAYNQIKVKMQRIYPALASGQTKLSVNLGSVRSIRVTIIGEVIQPGTFTLSSLSTLFNALYLSGGPSSRGSLRKIEIIRGNRVLQTVDFYSFLQKGLLDGNISLQDQDVIRVPIYTKRVAIDGQVKRPGLYELRDEETVQDLIQYAGGFSDMAYKGIAKITQLGDKERKVKDVSQDIYDRFVLKNADSVYFERISERFANRVVIEGAVYRPGVFELTPNLSLKEIIKKADGLRDDASLSGGYIKRVKPDLEKTMVSFNISRILAGTDQDIPLMREDSIMISPVQDLKDQLSVTIDGFVRSPGTFAFRKGMNVADVLAMAKGFTNEAANHRLEISRLVKNRTDTLANQLVTVIPLDLDSTFSNQNSSFILEPLDYIYVPRLVNYKSLGYVKIRGEVLFPGDYAQQRRDETAPEFIKRAGGVTPIASLTNAKVYRNGVRVDIDLTGTKLRAGNSALILMAGDSIYVPREIPFVEISGAVNTPQLLRYRGSHFKYYINGAGGVTENARLKGAYVQYANGINRPVRRFLFFRNYPSIQPGSKIIVPEKSGIPKLRLGFAELSGITSALTALVGLAIVLLK
ncbi:MAG: SLBB domain-containing protein [Daejeonella sp.]